MLEFVPDIDDFYFEETVIFFSYFKHEYRYHCLFFLNGLLRKTRILSLKMMIAEGILKFCIAPPHFDSTEIIYIRYVKLNAGCLLVLGK